MSATSLNWLSPFRWKRQRRQMYVDIPKDCETHFETYHCAVDADANFRLWRIDLDSKSSGQWWSGQKEGALAQGVPRSNGLRVAITLEGLFSKFMIYVHDEHDVDTHGHWQDHDHQTPARSNTGHEIAVNFSNSWVRLNVKGCRCWTQRVNWPLIPCVLRCTIATGIEFLIKWSIDDQLKDDAEWEAISVAIRNNSRGRSSSDLCSVTMSAHAIQEPKNYSCTR